MSGRSPLTQEVLEVIQHDNTKPVITQIALEATNKLPTQNILTQECLEIAIRIIPCYTDFAAECDFVY